MSWQARRRRASRRRRALGVSAASATIGRSRRAHCSVQWGGLSSPGGGRHDDAEAAAGRLADPAAARQSMGISDVSRGAECRDGALAQPHSSRPHRPAARPAEADRRAGQRRLRAVRPGGLGQSRSLSRARRDDARRLPTRPAARRRGGARHPRRTLLRASRAHDRAAALPRRMPALPGPRRRAAHHRPRHGQVRRRLPGRRLDDAERDRLRWRAAAGCLRHENGSAEPRLRAGRRALWRLRCRIPAAHARAGRLRRRGTGRLARGPFPRGADRSRAAPALFAVHGGASLMRILVTADPELEVPPRFYGGLERIVDGVVRHLRARGHQVGLVAKPGSQCEADAFYGWPGPSSLSRADTLANSWALWRAVRAFRPDVIHSSSRLAYLAPLLRGPVPIIMTYHRDPTLRTVGLALKLSAPEVLRFTGCSDYIAARGRRAGGDWQGIPNFFEANAFAFSATVAPDAPLCFLSRVESIKGAHWAIEIARRTGQRLVIAGNHAESGAGGDNWGKEREPGGGRGG